MNQEIKAKWVEALRSGKYQQGKGVLHVPASPDGPGLHCCLGVLCEVMRGPEVWEVVDAGEGLPPNDINEEAGLSGSEQNVLWMKNDGSGVMGVRAETFSEIADYIEANL